MFASKHREAKRLLQAFLHEYPKSGAYWDFDPRTAKSYASIVNAPIETVFQVVLLGIKTRNRATRGINSPSEKYRACNLAAILLGEQLLFTEDHVAVFMSMIADPDCLFIPEREIMRLVLKFTKQRGASGKLREAMLTWRKNRYLHGVYKADRPFLEKIEKILGLETAIVLRPGDAWSDKAIRFLDRCPEDQKTIWVKLIRHMNMARQPIPSESWLAETKELVCLIGAPLYYAQTMSWFDLVGQRGTGPRIRSIHHPADDRVICEQNTDILRGLVWSHVFSSEREACRCLCRLAIECYRKIPQRGPLNTKVGNACLWALGNMPGLDGVAQLAILKARVKFGTAQKLIDKTFNTAAEKAGLPRGEIEEMAVPAYGLEAVGLRREEFGDYTAKLVVSGSDTVNIRWFKRDGTALKSAPSAVKKDYTADHKELTQASKDIQRMLPAQRERIDSLFLAQKSWPYKIWRERYLDHPLVGVIARRLIWRFSRDSRSSDGFYSDNTILDVNNRAIDWLNDDTRVELWHPIGRPTDEILAWRRCLESHQVRQPLKQAHREIYILTDAERNTRTYSNRFAAHVLRQHQFNALCAARSWKNKLRLMVDAEYPPATRWLPSWNLRAEFWIEGIGDYDGSDANEAGVYHRVATDQVRFYPIEATQMMAHAGGGGYYARTEAPEPLLLERIPLLVFSEIMRDVDLFIGVASIGNDSTWQDGGPESRFRDYWNAYAFGTLSETANTRREVLASLLPRLQIADRCTLVEKFLVVRGDIRTYKIHLGSGNILMEPNDQYLCIVPGRSATKSGDAKGVFLPFEGDERLAVILSKALLLSQDKKITDPTIVRQIHL